MFGNLFENDAESGGASDYGSKSGISAPPRPRGQSQLCGIDNQGATCYLNSLLQTLLYTPEFKGLHLRSFNNTIILIET